MREDGGDGVVVSQAPLIEVAATRRVRVLGSLEDVAVWALAVNVGVGLGLAVSIDGKKAEARRSEETKDVGRKERGLGDPFVGGGGSARARTPLAQLGLVMCCHESPYRGVRRCSRVRKHRHFRRRRAIVEQERQVPVLVENNGDAVQGKATRGERETARLAQSEPAYSSASRIPAAGARVRGRSDFPDFHTGICHPASRARAHAA